MDEVWLCHSLSQLIHLVTVSPRAAHDHGKLLYSPILTRVTHCVWIFFVECNNLYSHMGFIHTWYMIDWKRVLQSYIQCGVTIQPIQ